MAAIDTNRNAQTKKLKRIRYSINVIVYNVTNMFHEIPINFYWFAITSSKM